MDRLEPDKGKHARFLTEHLTRQRTLPSSEEELQSLLKRKAAREQKRQLATIETTTNMAMEEQATADIATLEAAMAAHLARQAMAYALAARPTKEDAIASDKAASDAATGVGGSAPMQD